MIDLVTFAAGVVFSTLLVVAVRVADRASAEVTRPHVHAAVGRPHVARQRDLVVVVRDVGAVPSTLLRCDEPSCRRAVAGVHANPTGTVAVPCGHPVELITALRYMAPDGGS